MSHCFYCFYSLIEGKTKPIELIKNSIGDKYSFAITDVKVSNQFFWQASYG